MNLALQILFIYLCLLLCCFDLLLNVNKGIYAVLWIVDMHRIVPPLFSHTTFVKKLQSCLLDYCPQKVFLSKSLWSGFSVASRIAWFVPYHTVPTKNRYGLAMKNGSECQIVQNTIYRIGMVRYILLGSSLVRPCSGLVQDRTILYQSVIGTGPGTGSVFLVCDNAIHDMCWHMAFSKEDLAFRLCLLVLYSSIKIKVHMLCIIDLKQLSCIRAFASPPPPRISSWFCEIYLMAISQPNKYFILFLPSDVSKLNVFRCDIET